MLPKCVQGNFSEEATPADGASWIIGPVLLSRCQQRLLQILSNQRWTTRTMVLEGTGFLHDVRPCHITAGGLQLYAEIRGQTELERATPMIIHPSPLNITSDREVEALRKVSDTIKVDELIATISAHKTDTAVESLVELLLSVLPQPHSSNWTIPLLLGTSSTLAAAVLYFCLRAHGKTILKCFSHKRPPIPTVRSSLDYSRRTSSQSPENTTSTNAQPKSSPQHSYSIYAFHQSPPS
jgi:hypothetical protein